MKYKFGRHGGLADVPGRVVLVLPWHLIDIHSIDGEADERGAVHFGKAAALEFFDQRINPFDVVEVEGDAHDFVVRGFLLLAWGSGGGLVGGSAVAGMPVEEDVALDDAFLFLPEEARHCIAIVVVAVHELCHALSRFGSFDDPIDQFAVITCAVALGSVFKDGLLVARSFFEARVDTNGGKHFVFEVSLEGFDRFVADFDALIVEGRQDAHDADGVHQVGVDAVERLEDLLYAYEAQEVATYGNNDVFRVGQRVHVQQREAGATVQYDIVVILDALHAVFEEAFAVLSIPESGQEHFGRGECLVGGDDVEVGANGDHAVFGREVFYEDVVERFFSLDAQADSYVALRVEVDDEGPFSCGGQTGREVDRGGGLSCAALLVEYRDALWRFLGGSQVVDNGSTALHGAEVVDLRSGRDALKGVFGLEVLSTGATPYLGLLGACGRGSWGCAVGVRGLLRSCVFMVPGDSARLGTEVVYAVFGLALHLKTELHLEATTALVAPLQ